MSLQSIAVQRAALIRSISANPDAIRFPPNITIAISDPVSRWLDLESWVKGVGFRSQEADIPLRWLLRYCRDQPGPFPQELILLISWESLLVLYKALGRLDDDKDVLWSNLTWSFIRVVGRFDLGFRPDFIGKKLLNDTQNNTRRIYAIERSDPSYNQAKDPENDPLDLVKSHDVGHAQAEFLLNRSFAAKYLRGLVRSGGLSRPDYQILLGCHLYGRSIEEMAIHLGVPYGVAKKRRQRAEKKLQQNAPHLSPNHPDSPLYPIERSQRKETRDGSELRVPQNCK